ncbi:SdpI family protein [Agreia sp. COWG]|uniref:SdpI family protein n=1 Tax=Agreia sp. COWG TaxID=2773266 RepID=UPI001925FCBD|nr:SdpI family protein [Agreia sp. COWG]CAD6000568.1 conserved membrane protein of unknown function [Agreia sp. COWG]
MHTQDPTAGLAIGGWVSAALLLLIVVICVVAGRGSLPLNHAIGLRVPALMRDDHSWRVGHAAGVVPGSISFAVAAVSSVIGLSLPPGYWAAIATFIIGLVWVVVRASAAAKRA